MAGWFSRVSGGRRADAEPVEFTLTCHCGGIITGTRGPRMQVAVCPACAAQLCVLPLSPYPRPKLRTPKKKPVTPAVPRRSRDPDDNDKDNDNDEDAVRTPPPIPNRTGRQTSSSKLTAKKSSRADRGQGESARDAPLRPATPRKIVTPLRLVAVGMVAVVSLAGWWVAHRRAVARAVVTFAESSKSGRTALAKSEFDTADQQLTRAVTSLQLLGRDDREARLVRQLAREAAAANGLDTASLFELLGEGRAARNTAAPGVDWQQNLRRSHQGRWFLLESNGLQFAGGDPPLWSFSLPLIPGAEPVRIRGDMSNWARRWGSTPPAQVIFAAQLEDVRVFQDTTSKGWEIILKKDSLFLWTDSQLYGTLGGTLDETTRATLKSQAQIMGVAE